MTEQLRQTLQKHLSLAANNAAADFLTFIHDQFPDLGELPLTENEQRDRSIAEALFTIAGKLANTVADLVQYLVDSLKRRSDEKIEDVRRELDREPTDDEIDDALDPVMGPRYAGGVASTETTRTISNAEDVAKRIARRNSGVEAVAVWETEADDRVCPICRPLHNRPEHEWRHLFPVGPPAHYDCRCRKKWKLRRVSRQAGDDRSGSPPGVRAA